MRTLRLRAYCAASLALFLVIAPWSGTNMCRAAELDIDNIMQRMLAEKGDFDPKVLHEAGVDGLKQLFDKLFPQLQEMAGKALSPEEAAGLVVQLGAEKFTDRKAATEKLSTEAGEVYRSLVQKAIGDEDPEVNFRAKKILKVWAERNRNRPRVNYSRYDHALSIYMAGKHDEAVLTEMAKLVRRVFRSCPLRPGQQQLLSYSLGAVTRSGKDKITDLLIPLLEHPSDSIATSVTADVGRNYGIAYFPRLLLEALKSHRESVVRTALSRVGDLGNVDTTKAPAVKKLVTAIFNGDNEELKFQACCVMVRLYADKKAYAYLLAQTRSEDASRVLSATRFLADPRNGDIKATPELLAHLGPLMQSTDSNVRSLATHTLGRCQGAETVELLIPALGHPDENIRGTALYGLPRQTDKKMLREKLAAAIEDSKNETLVKNAKALLEKLGPE
jgi:HEAT repeats